MRNLFPKKEKLKSVYQELINIIHHLRNYFCIMMKIKMWIIYYGLDNICNLFPECKEIECDAQFYEEDEIGYDAMIELIKMLKRIQIKKPMIKLNQIKLIRMKYAHHLDKTKFNDLFNQQECWTIHQITRKQKFLRAYVETCIFYDLH